jgi:oligoribonuclease NrnB/cAMP/cGMP phosphodiesterase (DHH superfamily)
MFLKVIFVALFVSVFVSCDFISPKNTSLQNLTLTDTTIDYNTVDVYPLLSDCNNCDTNEKQNQCFENEFVKKLEKTINKNKIEVIKKIRDTVFVDLLIDNTGKISISKIYESRFTLDLIPKFDSILQRSIAALPPVIQPSLKRGIPVNTIFKLPVVVHMKK